MKKKIFVSIIALLSVVALLIIGTGCKDPVKVEVTVDRAPTVIHVYLTKYAPSGDVKVVLTGPDARGNLTKLDSFTLRGTYDGDNFNIPRAGCYTITATNSGSQIYKTAVSIN